jgi:uncharacterized membrane protein YgdD (TMEM256/DUF423 family)
LARTWLVIGAIFGLLSVALGAGGAHYLTETIGPDRFPTWQTGIQYLQIHSLLLVLLGVVLLVRPSKIVSTSALCIAVGIVLFCGSLITLALGGPRWLGAVAPVGGLAFMAGWALLIVFGIKSAKARSSGEQI